ncbi:hypothetical protein G7Y89_g13033 [Cudoniella acicularis]|uniref:Uncharacterized protein n=1 Tax=Cudoniella acicularis TaxID=354080 RepID=A0A8H4RAB0_9HELO|nr:hypothetical protein G7Y89_g13033 [Cudoniella acicularis]
MNADNSLGSVGDAIRRGYPQEIEKRISACVNPGVAMSAASLLEVLITITISKPVPFGTVGNAEKRGYLWESRKRISALINSNVAMLATKEFERSISMTISKLVTTTDAVAIVRVSHVCYLPCETTKRIYLARSPSPCADRARENQYQLATGPEKSGTEEYLTRSIWGCRNSHDIETGKKSLSVRILNSKTYYPQSPSIKHIMNAWSVNPYTTVIADFEYHTRFLPYMKHEGIFEIAMANANGEWIIPPTSINHGIPTLELCEKANTQLYLLQEKFSKPNHNAQIPM